MQKRWCLGEYLIGQSGKEWRFQHIFSKENASFTLPIERENNIYLNCYFNFRIISADRHTKDNTLVELYLCYSHLL